jgi:hypothetical protein
VFIRNNKKMSKTTDIKCVCGNSAYTTKSSVRDDPPRFALCGRCTPRTQIGKGYTLLITLMEKKELTPELKKIIIADTDHQRRDESRFKIKKEEIRKDLVSQIVTTEILPELLVGGQSISNLSVESTRLSPTEKWKKIPYQSLVRIFEYTGKWTPRAVSRRFYDCFMNNYVFSISSQSFYEIMKNYCLDQNLSLFQPVLEQMSLPWNYQPFFSKENSKLMIHEVTESLGVIVYHKFYSMTDMLKDFTRSSLVIGWSEKHSSFWQKIIENHHWSSTEKHGLIRLIICASFRCSSKEVLNYLIESGLTVKINEVFESLTSALIRSDRYEIFKNYYSYLLSHVEAPKKLIEYTRSKSIEYRSIYRYRPVSR